MIDPKRIKELRAKGKALVPIVQIGKDGLTENILTEIKKQLRTRKLIKIKASPAFFDGKDKKAEARALAESLKADVIDQVGFVIVVAKD